MIHTKQIPGFWGLINSKLAQLKEVTAQTNKYQTIQQTKEAEPVNKTGRQNHKVSANKMVVPIIIVLAILHIMVIMLIMMINRTSSNLAETQRNAGLYTQDATSLLSGSSLLSETTSTFILMPITESGEINVMPLNGYAQEYVTDHRGNQVLERFRTYDVSPQVIGFISTAADSANFMLDAQIHAISLMRSVHPLPDMPPLNLIPQVELTEEELAMSNQEREAAARALVLGSVYGLNKQSVSQNVNQAIGIIQGNSAAKTAQSSHLIGQLRVAMWIVTSTIIVILIITFVMLYRWILNPLGKFAKQIPTDDFLDETVGFSEVTLIASAYNDVLKRRNALDAILRSAAETDALTNLPNRYSFEQYMLESSENNTSLAVFLFDVDYLKKTNDTLGHRAGDKLICDAAACISECFGEKCFRFGGDEFAAIVEDCTPQSIRKMIEKFEVKEKERNISISYGYAYTAEIGKTSVKELLDEADRKMYDQKRRTHSERQD